MSLGVLLEVVATRLTDRWHSTCALQKQEKVAMEEVVHRGGVTCVENGRQVV
jgi:hypothetical protein